jgi:hypothetical protein
VVARVRIAVIVAALVGLAWTAGAAPPPRQVLPVPGTRSRLVLAKGEVWLETGKARRSLHLARYRPWKLAWARVAGQRQLAVGVYKKTRYQPKPHNALFLYDWNDGRLKPRWLGSRLSRPFTDFAFTDMRASGETELVSVERRADGRVALMVYRWTGFGFQGEWESQPYRRLACLAVQGPVVSAQVWPQAAPATVRIGWRDGAYRDLSERRQAE